MFVGDKEIRLLYIGSYLDDSVYYTAEFAGEENILVLYIGSYLDETVYDVDDSVGSGDIIFFHTGSSSTSLLGIGDNLEMLLTSTSNKVSVSSHLDYIVPEDLGGNLSTSSCWVALPCDALE